MDLLAADLTYGRGRAGASSGTETTPHTGAAVPDQPSKIDDDRADGAGPGLTGDAAQVPQEYAMTKKSSRAVRKQAGASRWAIRLGRLSEGIVVEAGDLHAEGTAMDLDGGRVECATKPALQGAKPEIALDICYVVLRAECGALALLKDKYREAKGRAKRADKRDSKGKGRSHAGAKGTRSYSSSQCSSGSSDVTVNCSNGGIRPARKPLGSSATPHYQRVFEST